MIFETDGNLKLLKSLFRFLFDHKIDIFAGSFR